MPSSATLEGPLSKWTNMIHGWQFRWFVLDQLNGLLSYYTSKENMSKGERRGCIRLKDAFVGIDNEDDITFTITVDDKTFHLQARNLDEREKWVSKVEKTIILHSSASSTSASSSRKMSHNKSISIIDNASQPQISDNHDNLRFLSLLDDIDNLTNMGDLKKFDSSLAESDAYLQLMIEQLKRFEEKRSDMLFKKKDNDYSNDNSLEVNNDESNLKENDGHEFTENIDQLNRLILSTENLIETLKHAMVCLQIAKANCDPSNVIDSTQDLKEVLFHFDQINNKNDKIFQTNSNQVNNIEKKNLTKQNNIYVKTEEKKSGQINDLVKKKEKIQVMPISSYSSSDDETSSNQNDINKNNKSTNIKNKIEDEDEDTVDENQFYESNLIEDEENDDYVDQSEEDGNDTDSFYDAIDQNTIASSYSLEKSNNSNEIIVKNTNIIATITNTTFFSNETTTDTQNFDTTLIAFTNETTQKLTNQNKANDNLNDLDQYRNISSELKNLNFNNQSNKFEKNLSKFDLIDYEEDVLQDDIDLNSQQSVITHLLTQVRIGMDLTKITLPTFILEPRSLLEMYADFFAHTDMFLEIPDITNPQDRMIQVTRWYMSTFHAGRKSPVAKKPYNPILGEIFQCWYTINSSKFPKNDDKILVEDGPVPWASRDQLTFIAEQVSHHPPISAFYAEHYNKRMQLAGYTWTKSKFLGLSIGVHMVGKAVLSLLDYDEEYIFTFPSAYGRSILTVPWFEMGGQVSITCAKTGYFSNIEFLTKPFYGGKKHQISGTINSPDKKVLYTIDGDWNGTMFIRSGGKTDILISTQSTPTFKKEVRPVSEQKDNESRRLWREVTYYLRNKNIELATSSKQRIEQKQRDDGKYRKEKNIKWQTHYFEEQGEHWVYNKPLVKRLQKN